MENDAFIKSSSNSGRYRFRAYFGLRYVHHHHHQHNQQCELHTNYNKSSPQHTAELEIAVVVAPVLFGWICECACVTCPCVRYVCVIFIPYGFSYFIKQVIKFAWITNLYLVRNAGNLPAQLQTNRRAVWQLSNTYNCKWIFCRLWLVVR